MRRAERLASALSVAAGQDQLVDGVGSAGFGEQEALGKVAAQRPQGIQLPGVSTPSATTIQPEGVREVDDGRDDGVLAGGDRQAWTNDRSILTKSSGNCRR